MASKLYRELIENNKDHPILVEVWSSTPWVVNSYTDSISNYGRYFEIMEWCRNNFGVESMPIWGKEGNWHSGSATIFGWTWIGFKTEEMMNKYIERWVCLEN